MRQPPPVLSSADLETMLDNLNLDTPTRELLEQSLNCTLALERSEASREDKQDE